MPRRYTAEKSGLWCGKGRGLGSRQETRSGESVHVRWQRNVVAGRGRRCNCGRGWLDTGFGACPGAGDREDRPDPADDRRSGIDRQADRQCGQALHAAEGRHCRRQEDRSHPQGRCRGSRQHQAPRARADRQRQGQFHCRFRRHPRSAGGGAAGDPGEGAGNRDGQFHCRFRRHPRSAGGGAAGDPGEGAGNRDGGGHLDHHRTFALYRADQFYPCAILHHHWRLGRQERHQEGRDADFRLRSRQRCAEFLQAEFYRGWRRDRRRGQGAARQSRLRAVPAADERCQARRRVRVRAGRAGRQFHEAICRARARQIRHQGDRPRRRDG